MSDVNQEYHVDTDEVLKELQAEGNEIEGMEPKAEEPEPEVPSQQEPEEAETVVETEPEAPEPKEVNRSPKEPTLIPAWKAKIAEDRLAKENEALKQQLEALQNNPTPENKQEVQDRMDDIRAIAEAEGLQLDDAQERFFNKLAATLTQKAVPQDLLKNVEAFQQHQQIAQLEAEYNQEFTRDIVPLVKEKYGDLPEKELATLSKKLHDLAFTDTYAKVPLKKVFLAESDDLKITPPKDGIVTHKSGRTRNADIDLSSIDEESFKSLDGDTLDKFIEQKSGQSSWTRR